MQSSGRNAPGALRLHRCLLTYELDWSGGHSIDSASMRCFNSLWRLPSTTWQGADRGRKVYWGRVGADRFCRRRLWSGLGDWVQRVFPHFARHTGAGCIYGWRPAGVRNDRFVNGALVWLRSVRCWPCCSPMSRWGWLLYPNLYVGDLYLRPRRSVDEHVAVWAVTICETLAVPALFLMMADRWRDAELREAAHLECC